MILTTWVAKEADNSVETTRLVKLVQAIEWVWLHSCGRIYLHHVACPFNGLQVVQGI